MLKPEFILCLRCFWYPSSPYLGCQCPICLPSGQIDKLFLRLSLDLGPGQRLSSDWQPTRQGVWYNLLESILVIRTRSATGCELSFSTACSLPCDTTFFNWQTNPYSVFSWKNMNYITNEVESLQTLALLVIQFTKQVKET